MTPSGSSEFLFLEGRLPLTEEWLSWPEVTHHRARDSVSVRGYAASRQAKKVRLGAGMPRSGQGMPGDCHSGQGCPGGSREERRHGK